MSGSTEVRPPSAIDRSLMRDVLGHFITGVVVVTGIDDGEPVGFTCQSFASLSLDPPLVTFAPSRTSVSWPRIRRSGGFCVNILAADQSRHSRTFARSGGDKFSGLAWSTSPSGTPVLDGVSAWIDCTLYDEYDGGDHTMVLGRIVALSADLASVPLLYHRGNYGVTAPLPLPATEEKA